MRRAHPRIGGLILALREDPQSVRSWERGAEGERLLGRQLDRCASEHVIVLHDRRIPGSRANLDHLVATAGTVFVVDAKHYRGEVKRREIGPLFRREPRLFVGRRDRAKLVVEARRQAEAVKAALIGEGSADVAVSAVLCFVEADWSVFSSPFEIDGVLVTWPKALMKLLTSTEATSSARVERTARLLASRFPRSG